MLEFILNLLHLWSLITLFLLNVIPLTKTLGNILFIVYFLKYLDDTFSGFILTVQFPIAESIIEVDSIYTTVPIFEHLKVMLDQQYLKNISYNTINIHN